MTRLLFRKSKPRPCRICGEIYPHEHEFRVIEDVPVYSTTHLDVQDAIKSNTVDGLTDCQNNALNAFLRG